MPSLLTMSAFYPDAFIKLINYLHVGIIACIIPLFPSKREKGYTFTRLFIILQSTALGIIGFNPPEWVIVLSFSIF